jgi:hypothetical protein
MSLNTILATAPLTATGYHLKATGTALGQSLIWDNGTNVAIGGTTITDVHMLNVIGNQSTVNVGVILNNTNATYARIYGLDNVNGNFNIRDYTASSDRLSISSTGAATFSSSVTATQLKAESSLNGDPELATFTNSNAGTGTEATIYVRNSSSINDGTFVQALGTAYTTTGGFFQDGGAIGTGTGLSGGLSLMVRANADMRFYTNGHTNERMRITSGGNVGIGTSFVISPYLVGSQTSGVLQVATNVAKTATTNSYPVGFFGSNDATYPLGLYIGILTGSTTATRQVKLQGTEIGVSANDIVMQTDGGNVSIGTTSSGRKLSVVGTSTPLFLNKTNNVSGSYCNIWALGGSETNATSSYYLYCDTDFVGVRVVIYGNGNIANVNNSYGAYSDIKLKENIADATPKLKDLLKVKIRNFNLKGSDIKQIGVVAQELEEVFPSMIEESNDTIKDEDGKYIETGEKTKTVKYSVFVPMLIKAIQELQEQINELKNK